ncbi:MAG: hypothetical protein LBL50_03295 [Candidatus Margulisbacteria bacterium]|jgi:hypothetical protein|nr:hypothetical protein [Candidatus Margulisiibacteriota bacterium]
MANNYTDSFAGEPYFIKKGEQLSAAGMTVALNTKEKVANKVTTINNQSTDTQYPSAKVVYDTLSGTNNDIVHKTGAETITGVKTFGTVDAAAEPLLGMAKTADATNDGKKFATEAQVYAVNSAKQDKLSDAQLTLLASLDTLGFFPKGTILAFSAAAWDAKDSAFKNIWKICDGAGNLTPNLVGKFLRGAAYPAGDTGGADSVTLKTENLPAHTHSGTTDSDGSHGHKLKFRHAGGSYASTMTRTGQLNNQAASYLSGCDSQGQYLWDSADYTSVSSVSTDNSTHKHGFTTDNTGSGTAFDIKPAYYTVIYIMKVA